MAAFLPDPESDAAACCRESKHEGSNSLLTKGRDVVGKLRVLVGGILASPHGILPQA